MAFHLLNVGLLWGLARTLGLSRCAATAASLLYACFFAHFGAIFFPTGEGHLIAVSAAISSLWLYLRFSGALPRLARLLGAAFLFGGVLTFVVAAPDRRPFALLLQAVTPFVAAVSSFLQPFQAALEMDSTCAQYLIPAQMGVWSLGLAGLVSAHFWAALKGKGRSACFVLLGGYLFSVAALSRTTPPRGPSVLPSESFVLISPLFAIAFAVALMGVVDRIQAVCRMSRGARAALLSGILLALCLPNVLAVRVGQLRGRLASNFASYHELKARQVDSFTPLLRQGIAEMKRGREAEALDLLRRAAATRPFLLRYLLGRCRFSDLRWITGPSGLRSWIRQVGEERVRAAGLLTPEDRGILQGIGQEMSDYALCLFGISTLERRAGHLEESAHWLSQMRYLERSPERIVAWVGGLAPVRGDPALEESVARLADPNGLPDPLPWRMDDYGFGRFLVRLWVGRDIRSAWDQQMGVAI